MRTYTIWGSRSDNPISVREGWQDDDAAFRQKSLTWAYLLYMSFIALETI